MQRVWAKEYWPCLPVKVLVYAHKHGVKDQKCSIFPLGDHLFDSRISMLCKSSSGGFQYEHTTWTKRTDDCASNLTQPKPGTRLFLLCVFALGSCEYKTLRLLCQPPFLSITLLTMCFSGIRSGSGKRRQPNGTIPVQHWRFLNVFCGSSVSA